MRPPEIPDEVVVEAGLRLLAVGRPVNGWALRTACGDRGKPDRLLQVWRNYETSAQVEAEAIEVPDVVAEAIGGAKGEVAGLLDRLLPTIYAAAEGVVDARRRAEFEALQRQLAWAEQQAKDATAAIEQADAEIARWREEAAQFQGDLANEQFERMRLSESLRGVEADLQTANRRVDDLAEQLTAAHAAQVDAEKARIAAEATAVAVQADADRLRSDLASERAELRRLQTANADQQAALASATTTVEHQRAEISDLKAAVAAADRKVQEAAAKAEAALAAKGDLDRQLAQARAELKSAQQERDAVLGRG
ncbi:MAG: DNA-binding protein [Alphaproteobacteria bacterium]|nr:DNA-binding protein [Alphaproteobacteria bacterium]